MNSYTIRKQDGKLEGPYSIRVIKAFVIAGKLTADDILISSEGEFPLSTHAELQSLWENKDRSSSQEIDAFSVEEMPLPIEGRIVFHRGKVLPPGPGQIYSGNFSQFSLPYLLYRLHLHQESGRLYLRHNDNTVDIFFEFGLPTYATSSNMKTRLGEILIQQSMLSRDQVGPAIAASEEEERPLGQILLREGLLSNEQIQAALTYQFKQRIFSPLGWGNNATYRFYPNQITGAQFPIVYDFFKLLQEGVFNWLPEARLNERLMPLIHHRVARMIHPKVSIDDFDLSTEERRLYLSILNQDPLDDVIGDIVEQGLLTEEEAYRVVFLLWQVDLLSVNEELLGTRVQHRLNELDGYITELNNQGRLQRLGLKGGASPGEIRSAYLELAREYHPDVLPPGTHSEVSRKMSEVFALIADAYNVLAG